jgi:DnaJ-class molecular chaperone
MNNKNLYTILCVKENATQDEIKKSYRKLQMKYHPDRDDGNAKKSQQINDAYTILGDIEKRQQYDAKKQNPFGGLQRGASMEQDIFKMFFGGQMPGMQGMPGMPGMPGIQGAFNMAGMPGGVHIFRNGVPMNFNRGIRKPAPIVKTIEISLEDSYTGINVALKIDRWIQETNVKRVEKETVYVNIKAGIDDGEIILLKNKGNVIQENVKGDIKVFIKINNTTKIVRKGLDLIYKKELTLKEALTGFSFDLKHLSGKTYTINNDNGKIIESGFNKILPTMGMRRTRPHPASPLVGNLIIMFTVKFPTLITKENREKLKEIL